MSARRPSRWASRGDRSATLAPANGLRPSIDDSSPTAPSGALLQRRRRPSSPRPGCSTVKLDRGADRLRRQPIAQRIDMLDRRAVDAPARRRRACRPALAAGPSVGDRGDQRAGRLSSCRATRRSAPSPARSSAPMIGPLEVVAAALRGLDDGATMLDGMAKPMPIEPPLRLKIAVLMPTSWPVMLISAPPELPGLIAASVWMKKPKSETPTCDARQRRDDAAGRRLADAERIADGKHQIADLAAHRNRRSA